MDVHDMYVVTFGEIMLRFTSHGYLRLIQSDKFYLTYAGSEANVAISLANYGINVEFITCLPDNPLADRCIIDLRGHKVGLENILRTGSRMGVMYIENGSNARSCNVYYDREHSAIADIEVGSIDWSKVFADTTWFHWTGITPAISQNAADECKRAIQCAILKKLTISCDLNYRKNLWNYGKDAIDVLPDLLKSCDLIFGADDDFKAILNITVSKSTSSHLFECFTKCKKIIVITRESINANSCLWYAEVNTPDNYYKSKEYEVTDVVDSIGAGDAFVGAYIYAQSIYQSEQDILEFATAAGCLKHTIHGDYNWTTKEEVEKTAFSNNNTLNR